MMRTWRRHRRTRPAMEAQQQAAVWQCVSLLLEYPEPALMERLDLLAEVAAELPPAAGEPIGALVAEMKGRALRDLQVEYVDTFDVTRKCSLHLTYFTDGDTRKRGVSLVQFKQAYRRAGVHLSDEQSELPDHLCILLEFGAGHDPDTAWRLLNDHRVGIELLHRALERRTSPWRRATGALRATLPALGGDDEDALRRLIAEGPPSEQVGLDSSPYAAFDPALDDPGQRHPLAQVPSMTGPAGAAGPVGAAGVPAGAAGPVGAAGVPAGAGRHGEVAHLGPTIGVGPRR